MVLLFGIGFGKPVLVTSSDKDSSNHVLVLLPAFFFFLTVLLEHSHLCIVCGCFLWRRMQY